MAQEKWLKKVALRREKGALQHPKQERTTWNNNWVKNGDRKKREVKKYSNANEPYESAKKNTVTKDRQLGGTIPQQSP